MHATTKSLLDLTAGDLMNPDVIQLLDTMPLRDAVHLLLKNQVSGAPVVNDKGRCVGVFSAVDFLRLSERPAAGTARPAAVLRPGSTSIPKACSYQKHHRMLDGKDSVLCTLPSGVCPIQSKQVGPDGRELLFCSEPHCVPVDWQVVEDEEALPTDEIRRFMTPDPVTVSASASIRSVARMMIDAHIHRVIVVNDDGVTIGVVSNTDILAALAYSDEEH